MAVKFFFGNKIESLSNKLCSLLNEEKQNDIFNYPTIVSPNLNLIKYLQMEIARQNSICLNIEFKFLENGLVKALFNLVPEYKKENYLFLGNKENHLDLQLMILTAIEESGENELEPIKNYIGKKDSRDYQKRLWQLTDKLTQFFREYEYQREDMIENWKIGKVEDENNEMEKCQFELYKKVFSEKGILESVNQKQTKQYIGLPKFTENIFNELKKNPVKNKTKKYIYIFGFSQISKFHYKLIFQLADYYEIRIFQLNFLEEFWNDSTEKKGIENVIEKNDNENEILKLWARPSRENTYLLKNIINADKEKVEINFLENEKNINDFPNLLRILQDEIASKKLNNYNYKNEVLQDRSLQIIGCPGVFREVETVFDSIVSNMQKNKDLKLTDIAILVPNMNRYKSVIQSVFLKSPIDKLETDIHSRISLPFNLTDSSASDDSIFGEALLAALQVATGNFTRKEIFDLIFNQCFLEANNLTHDDAVSWLNIADGLNIFHTYDNKRIDLYSWNLGLKRLRFGRIMELSGESFKQYQNIIPYSDIETVESGRLDKFITTMENLLFKLNHLKNKSLSGDEWAKEIISLINDFFNISESREKFVSNQIIEDLNRLKNIDKIAGKTKLSLAVIVEFIKSNLENIPTFIGRYLSDGISVSSLLQLRPVPFKIIYILGLGEGEFPGFQENSTIDLRNAGERKTGDISQPDSNKYLFLETLMSVREKLYLFYISKDTQKDEELFPCSVINQLKSYIDKNILKKEYQFFEMPLNRVSKRYFLKEKYIKTIKDENGNELDIKVDFDTLEHSSSFDRMIFSGENIRKTFFDKELLAGKEKSSKEKEVSIKELAGFLKNPALALIKKHLNIYDYDEEDRSLIEDEPFYTQFPFDYEIITETLNNYVSNNSVNYKDFFDEYYEYSLLQGKTPQKVYGKLDKENLRVLISERITGGKKDGLENFILNLKNKGFEFYKNISFGEIKTDENIELKFESLVLKINDEVVKITGSLPFLWKNKNILETLVITNSSYDKNILISKYVFESFLFYILILNSKEPFFGNVSETSFIINISYKKNKLLDRHIFKINISDAKKYLENLVKDFLFLKEYDNITFDIISKLVKNKIDNFNPLVLSKERIEEVIEDEERNDFSISKSDGILEIIETFVPENPFDKIKNRFEIIYKSLSFAGEENE